MFNFLISFITKTVKFVLGLTALLIVIIVVSIFAETNNTSTADREKIKELLNPKVEQTTEVVVKKEPVKVVVNSKPWENTDAYRICYAQLTKVHKANGLHDRNRMQSIEIKETMCKAQAGY